MNFAFKNFLLVSMWALSAGCEHSITYPQISKIEFLGFEDKLALRLVLAEPHLYVCAGSDGLWRRNIRQMTAWEYMGLADTSLGKYANVGVLDMEVVGQDLLVAYNGAAQHVDARNTVGIWRKTNGGQNWFRSDSGIQESIVDPFEYNIINSLQKSPHRSEVVIAVYGSATYVSMDHGYHWRFHGARGVAVNTDYVRWHPYQPGEVWILGETSVFAPYLRSRKDYGLTPKVGVNFKALGFPNEGTVTDVAFDIGNPNIIYAATSNGLIRSSDGGYTWQLIEIRIPGGIFILRLVEDTKASGGFFLAGGTRIYYTSDGTQTINLLTDLGQERLIQALALDKDGKNLFAGTTRGVYTIHISDTR